MARTHFFAAWFGKLVFIEKGRSGDGNKYLYGNEVTVTASATDDVRIDRMQYKITYDLDGETLSLPWTDTEDITWMDDNKTAVMSMSIPSGNFAVGRHQVGVQAVDAAGNVRSKTVVFTIDYCNHKADGTTQCVYENEVAGIPDPVEVFPGATDPPYVIIWGLAGLLLLTMVAAFMVVVTSMRSPKAKKKGDGDEDADEDWMSEFIGTSQDLDMASITGTEAKKEPESERKTLDDDDDEDDPFAVNKPTQKRRRRKSSEPEEDEDDDDDDDEEDGFMEALEEAKPKKRSPPRKRRAVSKSSDDEAPKRRTPPKRRAVKRKSED